MSTDRTRALKCRAEQQAKIDKMQADLRKLKKRSGNASDSDSDDDRKRRRGPSALEQELARYSNNKGRAAARQHQATRKGRRDEEDDILAQMAMFTKKVAKEADEEDERRRREADEDEDNDDGWMNHDLKFDVDEKELTRRAEEDYAVSLFPMSVALLNCRLSTPEPRRKRSPLRRRVAGGDNSVFAQMNATPHTPVLPHDLQ